MAIICDCCFLSAVGRSGASRVSSSPLAETKCRDSCSAPRRRSDARPRGHRRAGRAPFAHSPTSTPRKTRPPPRCPSSTNWARASPTFPTGLRSTKTYPPPRPSAALSLSWVFVTPFINTPSIAQRALTRPSLVASFPPFKRTCLRGRKPPTRFGRSELGALPHFTTTIVTDKSPFFLVLNRRLAPPRPCPKIRRILQGRCIEALYQEPQSPSYPPHPIPSQTRSYFPQVAPP